MTDTARAHALNAAARLAFPSYDPRTAVFGTPDAHPDTARCSSLPPTPPTPVGPGPRPADPARSAGIRLCGALADHVDHVDPRLGRGDSALKPTGSTRRWRRIRAFVLNRDGHRCQVLVDESGRVVEAERPATPPAGPDDPAWLRATCPAHNLSRGASTTDARSTNDSRPSAGRWDW